MGDYGRFLRYVAGFSDVARAFHAFLQVVHTTLGKIEASQRRFDSCNLQLKTFEHAIDWGTTVPPLFLPVLMGLFLWTADIWGKFWSLTEEDTDTEAPMPLQELLSQVVHTPFFRHPM